MSKYKEADELIVRKITKGKREFLQLYMDADIVAAFDEIQVDPYRGTDRRLQALRKAGGISFGKICRGWSVCQ